MQVCTTNTPHGTTQLLVETSPCPSTWCIPTTTTTVLALRQERKRHRAMEQRRGAHDLSWLSQFPTLHAKQSFPLKKTLRKPCGVLTLLKFIFLKNFEKKIFKFYLGLIC